MKKLFHGIHRQIQPLLERAWMPYSRLFLLSDDSQWVISEEMKALAQIARNLHIRLGNSARLDKIKKQVVFYGSRYSVIPVLREGESVHRIGFPYFHGLPGTGYPGFDEFFQDVCKFHDRISRIQVTHTEVHEKILETGISPQKVFRIPIGIDISNFSLQTPMMRQQARRYLNIPQSAFVIGSFQKDGDGWAEGFVPKLIKGPDIFLKVISIIKNRIPELFILLTGPARGFVKKGLEDLGVPYCHVYLDEYIKINMYYQALDLYLITSRQEGGPKALLESMASGVPLVTTRVGHAMDLVNHGINGWMVDVEDVDGLAYWSEYILQHRASLGESLHLARQAAEENSYQSQLPLWSKFMQGFVEK